MRQLVLYAAVRAYLPYIFSMLQFINMRRPKTIPLFTISKVHIPCSRLISKRLPSFISESCPSDMSCCILRGKHIAMLRRKLLCLLESILTFSARPAKPPSHQSSLKSVRSSRCLSSAVFWPKLRLAGGATAYCGAGPEHRLPAPGCLPSCPHPRALPNPACCEHSAHGERHRVNFYIA